MKIHFLNVEQKEFANSNSDKIEKLMVKAVQITEKGKEKIDSISDKIIGYQNQIKAIENKIDSLKHERDEVKLNIARSREDIKDQVQELKKKK